MRYEVYCLMADDVIVERTDSREAARGIYDQLAPASREAQEVCIALAIYEIDEYGFYMVEREWKNEHQVR